MSGSSDRTVKASSSTSPTTQKPSRPSLLAPPATIVSPPSPVETKSSHLPDIAVPERSNSYDSSRDKGSTSNTTSLNHTPPSSSRGNPSRSSSTDGGATIPQPNSSSGNTRPRGPSDSLGPIPLAATFMSTSPGSTSPRKRDSLVPPESPDPTGSPRRGSLGLCPRSPSPSSPQFFPKRPGGPGGGGGHRRESSTHRVRETMDGEQRNTESGDRIINQYSIGKSLGKGAFAKVELAVDVGTGQEYAIKEFSKSRLHYHALQEKQRQMSRGRIHRARASPIPGGAGEGKRKGGEEDDAGQQTPVGGPWGGQSTIDEDPLGLIRREIAVMKKLDHPNIVHLYEVISVPNADSLFLVLEYMSGGVLMHVQLGHKAPSPPFEIDQSREYFRQLCLGLEYLHENEVVHRDVKPDNILLSADRTILKLCDFGVSEMFVAQGDDRIKKSGGSPAFLSPESFTSHVHDVHGKAVDIWALGVTLYCMLTGSLPFNTDNAIELFEIVKTKDPEIPNDWDEDLKDLVHKMLNKDPSKRMQMTEIKDHPWVTVNGEEPMIPTDDNLYHIGKRVEEPTQEELKGAIGSLRGVFTVIRAVQKMRRLQLHRRSLSGATPSSPGSGPGSTNVSHTSGSMDSYASQYPGTDISSLSDYDESKYRDFTGEHNTGYATSPKRMMTHERDERDDDDDVSDFGGGTERMDSTTEVEGDRQDHEDLRGRNDDDGQKGDERKDQSPGGRGEKGKEEKEKECQDKFEGLKISTNVKGGLDRWKGAGREGRSPKDEGQGGGEEDVQIVDSPVDTMDENHHQHPGGAEKSDSKGDDSFEEVQSPVQIMDSPTDAGGDVSIMDSPVDADEGEMPPKRR